MEDTVGCIDILDDDGLMRDGCRTILGDIDTQFPAFNSSD